MIDSFIASPRPSYEDRCDELHHLYRDCPKLEHRETRHGHRVSQVEWYDRESHWPVCGGCEDRAAKETRPVVVILNHPEFGEIYSHSAEQAAAVLDFLHGERRLDAHPDEWERMEAEDVAGLDYEVREMTVLELSRVRPLEP